MGVRKKMIFYLPRKPIFSQIGSDFFLVLQLNTSRNCQNIIIAVKTVTSHHPHHIHNHY